MYQIIKDFQSKLLILLKGELFKSLSVYTLMGFANKALPILLLPFLTRVLIPFDYGIIAMFATVRAFFGPFVGLGSPSSVERYYFDKNEINFPQYLSNILLILAATAIFFGGIFLIFSNQISSISGVPKSYLWVAIVVSLGTMVNKINLIIYRVQFKSKSFAYLSIFETSMYFLLMTLFVFGFNLNWRADIYSQLIIYIILGLWGIYILKKSHFLDLKFHVNILYIKSALAYGLPMFVHAFGLFFVNMTDKLFITYFVGIDATGIYNIGFKMATIIVFFITAFNNAYVPWLYGKLKINTKASLIKAYKSTLYSAIFVALVGLLILILLPYLYPIFVGEKFSSSINVSKIILIGEVFNAYYLLLMGYILFEKATKYIMYITLSTSIISVLLNIWLIPIFAIKGAAYTLFIVYFIKFLLTFLFAYHIQHKKQLSLS